ncbi:MAG: response regulator transcription factor [Novosphingobium sp.]|nr:response regulator transcription factor [Novosphingobium sp.]
MTKRRVYVVDDEEPIRRSSRLMLSVLGYDVAAFETGSAFLDSPAVLEPGCILLDIRMPHVDGLQVQQELNRRGAPHPVVMMSGHGDIGVAVPAFENGAVAFLEKPFSRAALVGALEVAFAKLEDGPAFQRYVDAARVAIGKLREGDAAVLHLIAGGFGKDAIAAELGVPVDSVEVARARIFAALGIDSITDALRLAFAGGIRAP